MPNLQNIIEENKKSLNDTSLFRAGGSCWEVCDFEAICEDIKENNHLSQLRLIEWFREMVKGMKRKKGTDDYVLRDQDAWYNQAIREILSELGNINEIK